MSEPLYDTIAVNIDTKVVQVMAKGRTLRNAEAITKMAVARRGVDTYFYVEAPTGKFKDGDVYVAETVD